MTDINFALSVATDRKLFWDGGQSVRYLVARVSASNQKTIERAPLNIALVIDASGSMIDGKLDAAKQAALGLAERLTSKDRLTVVSFASDVQVHLDAVSVTRENMSEIRFEVSRLETRGMTNLSGGWFAGVDCAARITEQNALMTPRVIILSDGHANEGISDGAELCEHAGELRSRGVLTSALGIGDGYDEQLLRGIAENGGGRLHDAELTEEIGSVLLGELDDIFGTVAEEVRLSVTYPAEVRLEPLGNVTAETFGGRTAVYIGSVKNAVERLVVFKVTCPASLHADELQFDANATGRAIDDRSELRAESLTVKLTAAKRTRNMGQPRDGGLAMVVARTWSAHLVAKAAKMNRDGVYQEAQKLITSELKHFRRYVQGLEGGPRMIRELELLSHSVRQAFSPRMSKELVFQSALHMESRSDWRGAEKESWSARMARGD